MWKYVSRRFRDTFERTANQFEKRGGAGVVNSPAGNLNEEKNKRSGPPCRWYARRCCWNAYHNKNDTNNNKWNFDYLNRTWIGAITWSSALALGWYASQIIHLKLKYNRNDYQKKCPSINVIFETLRPYINDVNKHQICFNSVSTIEKVVEGFTPSVQLVSNDRKENKNDSRDSSGISADPENSNDALGNVLNSIENRLGLAAIENGQVQDGLSLLRSAANRHHAPALYNLGLCYEKGLGVNINEKTAMELYRSAAALQHPGALYNLGIYYGQGRGGLPHDLDTATRLLRLAAVQGQQDAIDALKTLDIDINTPPPKNDVDLWTYRYSPFIHRDHDISTPSSLFVEKVNCLQSTYEDTYVF